MTDKFTSFRQHFGEVIASVQRYGFFVRASEFHDQSVEKLLELKKECIERKNEAIAINNEDEANACLCFEYITETLIKEFEFYIKLKPYMGQLCGRIITEAELREVSFVDEPSNKHCRVTSFTEGEVTCNALTHRA